MKPRELCLLVAFALRCVTVVAAPSPSPASAPAKRATTIPVKIETAKVSNITTTLGLRPWPRKQYTVSLGGDWFFTLSAESYTLTPRPATSALQHFIYTFSDDIEAAYPPPSLAPPRATLEHYDTDSFTEWGIEEFVHSISGSPAPTEIVAKALSKIAIEMGRYGPPRRLSALILTPRNLPWLLKWKHYNLIEMGIYPMEAHSLQANGGNGTDHGFVSTS